MLKKFSNNCSKFSVDWELWLYGKRMPASKPSFDDTTVKPCLDLAKNWQNWNQSFCPPITQDFKNLTTLQKLVFLSTLLEGKLLPKATLVKMFKVNMVGEEDPVVQDYWFRLSTKNQYDEVFDDILMFLRKEAPTKPTFVTPLLKMLLSWDQKKNQVVGLVKEMKNSEYFMKVINLTDRKGNEGD